MPPATPNSGLTPRDRWILACILVGALVVRLIVMWMPGDPMFENGALPFEELQRGNATNDLMRGPLLPLLDYQVNHFTGGSLVVSILAMPFFWLFGPGFNVLRLVSLLFSIPLVWAVFTLAWRRHGRRAAIVAGLLVAFGPPGFVFLSGTVYGTHPESNFLAVGLVLLWFAWTDAGRGGVVRSACLGLAFGFALWFSYGLVLIVGILLACDFASAGVRRLRASDLSLGLGFLVGFAPWIIYMLTHPGRAFSIYDSSITEHVQAGLQTNKLEKAARLLTTDGPAGFWMHGAWAEGGIQLARVLLFVFVGAILWCAWISRAEFAEFGRALLRRRTGFAPSLRLVALLFVGSWFTAFVLTDFEIDWGTWVQGYRYLMPFWPFMAIVLGIAVQDLATRGRVLVPSLVVAAVCATHVGFTLVQSRPDRWSAQWAAQATQPLWHMRMFVLRFGWDEASMKHVLQRALETRTPQEQSFLAEHLARGIARFATEQAQDPKWAAHQDGYRSTLEALCTSGPEPFRETFERARAAAVENAAKH